MMGKNCSFKLDPESVEKNLQFSPSELTDNGIWVCPHDCADGSDYCIFHKPVEEKESESVQEQMLKHLERADNASNEYDSERLTKFIGIRVDRLEFRSQILGEMGTTIDMRAGQIGELILEHSIVNSALNLRGCAFERVVQLDQSTFESDVELTAAEGGKLCARGAQFRERLLIEGLTLESDLVFERTTVEGVIKGDQLMVDGEAILRDADLHAISSFSRSEFSDVVSARNATLRRRVDFSATHFEKDVDFTDTEFEAQLRLSQALFDGVAEFSNATFEEQFTLDEVTFREGVNFDTATFLEGVSMQAIAFEHNISFVESTFEGPALFTETHFRDQVNFSKAIFQKRTDFSTVSFDSVAIFDDVTFNEPVSFNRSDFAANANFKDTTIESKADFSEVLFQDKTDFEGATVRGELEFSLARVDEQQHQRINLKGVTIESGTLPLPRDGGVVYDLEEATLGDALIATGEVSQPLDHYRLVNVTYNGFDFARKPHREALQASEWNLHRTVTTDERKRWTGRLRKLPRRFGIIIQGPEDMEPHTLESTYIKAKNGANAVGDSIAASEFFQREKLFRRQKHRSKLMSTESSVRDRFKGLFGWCTNFGFSIVSGYGERPLRVVTSSLAFIVASALIYQSVTPGPFEQAGFGAHLLFSFQSFIAFIVGTPPGADAFHVQLLSSLQGFFGAFLIALFVFTLTRSVDR